MIDDEEVISQDQLAGGPNEDDLIKIKILSQAAISIGSIEKLLVLMP